MTNSVSTQLSFQDRLKSKIQESMGDLMTDEDLAKIVEQGIQSTFFERRPNPRYANASYHEQRNMEATIPPLIETILKDVLGTKMEALVAAEVDKWFVANEDKIQTAVQETVTLGAGGAMLKTINHHFQQPMQNLSINVDQMVQSLRSRGIL